MATWKQKEQVGLFRYSNEPRRRERIHARLKSLNRHRCCQICGKAPVRDGTAYPILDLDLDHDHQTGFVRDYLCAGCNTGLGAFKDDPDVLDKAAEYLRRHQWAHSHGGYSI